MMVFDESRTRSYLLTLTIEDFGLIEYAQVRFSSAFTIISGETGSGKTMVLGALSLVLGDRLATEMVRQGAQRARLTLEFRPSAELFERFEAADLPLDEGEDGVIVREFRAQGRSTLRVNGRPATAGQVRELMRGIVERVGQHEGHRLLNVSEHLQLLDRFAGAEVSGLRQCVATLVRAVQQASTECAAIASENEREAVMREAAQADLHDITTINPQDNEDLDLALQRDRLRNTERILSALENAHELLGADETSVTSQLNKALMAFRSIERYGTEYAALSESTATFTYQLQELLVTLAASLEKLPSSDAVILDTMLERLERIERLKRRHGGSLLGVRQRQSEASELLAMTASRDNRYAAAQKILLAAQVELTKTAAELTLARKNAALELERLMKAELETLAMPAARFVIEFEALSTIQAGGAEKVRFLLAAHQGAVPLNLTQGISGGELSRVLLAFMMVTTDDAKLGTVIFDEIDAGIGGSTALAVAERLTSLAKRHQIICVTHLAQIAARGSGHVVVKKNENAQATTVELVALDVADDRIDEIARMLSGDRSHTARDHAATLLGFESTTPRL